MNWQNFQRFTALHLKLGPCLSWHIGPPCLRNGGSHPDFTFQSWVEQRLEYLAVRPFHALDQEACDSDSDSRSVTYVIWHHIGNEEQPFSRLRYISSDGGGTTIAQAIANLVDWHSRYWALQENRPLVLDAIVRQTTRRRRGERYYRESVEIFLVPDVAQPTPLIKSTEEFANPA